MKITLLAVHRVYLYLGLTFFATLCCLFSCKKDIAISNKVVTGEAKVKLVNASHTTSAVDFYLDNVKVNTQSLAYGEGSNYFKVSSGTKNASFANTDENASAKVIFVPTFSYTSFYVEDKSNKGEVLTFEDNLGTTAIGKANVRFINLSPYFSNAVNVNLTGNVLLINSLPFKEASDYFSIDPTIDLRISILGVGGFKVLSGAEFEAGKIYTIWFSGTSNSNLTINKITYN
ncbi:DUF4397 domain-containing protein [Pedobacter boryungensis]|uniref:DUF4397 domain-containing protein n=1 Tax=Pedobacter boryungensis TaxID=869962 RepID=A0ABX2D8B0_9SPHI|nr:DUF4397 domain-containing protein [Pedobacter boryungensis]NQX30280.1 DUF4397 domain-containing protein [Pedobacter boryungensis]